MAAVGCAQTPRRDCDLEAPSDAAAPWVEKWGSLTFVPNLAYVLQLLIEEAGAGGGGTRLTSQWRRARAEAAPSPAQARGAERGFAPTEFRGRRPRDRKAAKREEKGGRAVGPRGQSPGQSEVHRDRGGDRSGELQAPILVWPVAPLPEASQGAPCLRISHPAGVRGASSSSLEEKLPARRQNCSASSLVTPGAPSAAGSARTFQES
ncbi:hypothetical protein J1605_000202 [Eschrichtius robustus]|uniref:Uncharacterized protein n=1 Tax=Eschrichtius robustus TaxID=9764 RepID=A0AB34HQ39_ESCRO|nr:hypothetical protein J1605_000202 [Eschrichtius robustus]